MIKELTMIKILTVIAIAFTIYLAIIVYQSDYDRCISAVETGMVGERRESILEAVEICSLLHE
jgi:hypothetical protein